ncbi:Do family serine endopeptidase [Pontixanthobacter aestiaquae]|uniref:Probable periplasmic serine endoprotease DegP-like n=1 Tax=Pontixanthobacter aestiaquae TaxID=1509367 RepID=A0A844ZBA5_9SPHN|nr:Do family serine endopeptidase [Pontixanthobacter aestiaquae]MDN3644600.1 Do family serine endopeptidase [Pontixanthobacter aestiaquae]MXO84393.1 Do family serine endopeptidase [Pontixanthobacter aestiaquae]
MRYAYGLTSALLVGGAAISLVGGYPAGAQTAQNEGIEMQRAVPRAGAPESFANLTEQLQPAVVNISTRQRIEVSGSRNPFAGTPFEGMFGNRRGGGNAEPQFREGQSLGSGFIISADGFVVTNNHVVSPNGRGTVEEITVTLPDGQEYDAELIGADADSDLAVLKIKRSDPFPFVKFGESDEARVGDWVIAIGNPFGLGGTVTSGIVSSVLRNTGSGAYDRYIQTDASINRGNSGGPLFDMQGNVIGINNAIYSPSGGSVGIGFAIPAEVASPIVDQLKSGEAIERGFLGVSIQPVDEDLAASLGLPKNQGEFVQLVQPDAAADKAGIRAGDIVTKVDGKAVTQDQTLSFLVANVKPGETIPIELYREGKRRTVQATVGKRPSAEEMREQQMFSQDEEPEMPDEAENESPIIEKLGLQVVPLTPTINRRLGVSSDTEGLAIVAVDRNSDAARKGLQRRDIIKSANYQPVNSVEDLEKAVTDAEQDGRDAVLLQFQRPGGPTVYRAVRIR